MPKVTKLSLVTTTVAFVLVGASASYAACISCVPTDATFFTAPSDGMLTFTFEGSDAAFTDIMRLTFNNTVLFNNHAVGQLPISLPVTAGQIYELNLFVQNTGISWTSDPTDNGGVAHLASTGIFSDFGIGSPLIAINTNCAIANQCYLGWEDLTPSAPSDNDFNDLVFALQFTPVPEPATLALFSSGLFALT